MHLNSDFVQSLGYPYVPEFNQKFMLPGGVGGVGVGACVVCTPPPPPVLSPIKTKTFTMNYIYTDTTLVP